PFDDGSFDTIVSFETLEHVPDPEAVLREFHRVCRKNVILSVPNCQLPKSLEASRLAFFHYTDRSHVSFFTCDSLTRLLRQTGFEAPSTELINACPTLPLLNEVLRLPPFLTRLVGKLAKKDAFQMTILSVANKEVNVC
ncbi:MAG: class I SAM-dependent methyltransferase, partial [Planctomycetaceae bacterium]